MNHHYKITLLPLAPYFFGTEMVSELGNRQNYFQRSLIFPQQTTLLGILRHQILLSQGLAYPKVDGATDDPSTWIGKSGFIPNANEANQYGIINSISPMFLSSDSGGEYFLFDKQWVVEDGKPIELTVIQKNNATWYDTSARNKPLWQLCEANSANAYDSKSEFKERLRDISRQQSPVVDLAATVEEVEQIGVYQEHKHHKQNETTQDKGYYKNVYRRLVGSWKFGFYAELTEHIFQDATPRVALIGKERSPFLITIESAEPTDRALALKEDYPDQELVNGLYRITLLSDCYVKEEASILDSSLLANMEGTRFRHILTTTAEKHNYNRPQKSKVLNLIKRGSVIYTEKPQEIAKVLLAAPAFRQIGYNYFLIENITPKASKP